jgi:hypothetical protein
VRALPKTDQVTWVGSLGQRAPTFQRSDWNRVSERLTRVFQNETSPRNSGTEEPRLVEPIILPWHRSSIARVLNEGLLAAQVRRGRTSRMRPVLLVTNPVSSLYLEGVDARRIIYLRLDDHPRLPGVDAGLVADAEARLVARAHACLATAPELALPGKHFVHLPQGVDAVHFGKTSLEVPKERILGFFGALAPWLDTALIESAARALPEWTFEFVGPRMGEVRMPNLPNVVVKEPIPYAELPKLMSRWRASWIPFVLDELTRGVDPLKARESLAAGLPTLGTGMPALARLPLVNIVDSAAEVSRVLADILHSDGSETRALRRRAMQSESWAARAQTLRRVALQAD